MFYMAKVNNVSVESRRYQKSVRAGFTTIREAVARRPAVQKNRRVELGEAIYPVCPGARNNPPAKNCTYAGTTDRTDPPGS